MGREAIKIPQIRSVYGDQIICDGGPFGVGRQGGEAPSPYYPVGDDAVFYHAYWSGAGTDRGIYGNDATLTGGSFGELGASLDGLDDIITVVHHDSMDFGTGDCTLAMWANYTNVIVQGYTVSKITSWCADVIYVSQCHDCTPLICC